MKTTFTFSIIRTFAITLITVISAIGLSGQTTHNVTVSNFSFNPDQITINAGDKVVWTNTGGTHNINGTQTKFPTNPESFSHALGAGWTYEYIFNTPGTYDYQCDPHAALGMVGSVIVNPATANEELAGNNSKIRLYPNPASEYFDLLLSEEFGKATTLKIYSANGTLVDQKVLPQNAKSYKYELANLKNGLYFIELNAGAKINTVKFLKQ